MGEPSSSVDLVSEDGGHRHGNFHNYYSFHPPVNRLKVLQETGILDYVVQFATANNKKRGHCDNNNTDDAAKRQKCLQDHADHPLFAAKSANGSENMATVAGTVETQSPQKQTRQEPLFRYCDLGCNEGDLTAGLALELTNRIQTSKKDTVAVVDSLGLDMDATLIGRACENHGRLSTNIVPIQFQICNLCQALDHETAYSNHLSGKFDLTSIFSTTMWIHVHAGDNGLKDFLHRACQRTKLLLIEPQPSKCYRSARVRLERLGRPDIPDISFDRLKMRQNIEQEIANVIISCGFQRVVLDENKSDPETTTPSRHPPKNSQEEESNRTVWKRALQLYERITDEEE
eukprot:scaffold23255_cov59-Attheya_sp.AAC.3